MQIDVSRWTCVYPAYLNSKLTERQGRRVNKALAVEDPSLKEVVEVLNFLQLEHVPENKAYPRDILQRGRVRVRLRSPQGGAVHPEVTTSKL